MFEKLLTQLQVMLYVQRGLNPSWLRAGLTVAARTSVALPPVHGWHLFSVVRVIAAPKAKYFEYHPSLRFRYKNQDMLLIVWPFHV